VLGRTEVVGVEQWAGVRRLYFVRGLSIREIHRRTGLHRDTIRDALSVDQAPRYSRAPAGSKLDPFKDEIHRLLRDDPRLPGQRVRELIAPLGFDGGKTIVDDYLREVRPLFAPRPRTFQRTVYRSAEIGRCLWSLGALPETLVWDRQAGLHAGGGRPTGEFGAFCGQLKVDWHFCEPRDPQPRASSSACRTSSSAASSPAGRSRMNSTSSCNSTRGSLSART
jgi:hypothetical protein